MATITEIQGNRLLIHFDGWTKYYDYWCQPDTIDIHPIGWCEDNGHELQKPNGKLTCLVYVEKAFMSCYIHKPYKNFIQIFDVICV